MPRPRNRRRGRAKAHGRYPRTRISRFSTALIWRGSSTTHGRVRLSCFPVDRAARLGRRDGHAGEHGELAGEGFRGRRRRSPARQEWAARRPTRGRCSIAARSPRENALALRPAIAKRGERVAVSHRLRDEQRNPALRQRSLAIAELRAISISNRQPRIKLEPVFRHQPGIEGGAAGRDVNARQARQSISASLSSTVWRAKFT